MSILSLIKQFVAAESTDLRRTVRIFGYYPYYGFRRVNFERQVKTFGFAAIKRKKARFRDIFGIFKLVASFRQTNGTVYLINGNDGILRPPAGSVIFGYYSRSAATLNVEILRVGCHIFGAFLSPFFLIKYSYALSLKEAIAYTGDAIYYQLIKLILRSSGAGELVLTVSYSHYPVVAAARALHMTVTELQHGAISPCHIGYSGPIDVYFPDVFVPLDNTWQLYISQTSLPFDPCETEQRWLDQLPVITPSELWSRFLDDKVLVIGQETVHDALYAVYRQLKALGMSIEYRFHPRMKASEIALHEQVAQCSLIIGCYSTVLVEYVDAKTIVVLDEFGAEFLDVLRGNENVLRLKGDSQDSRQIYHHNT